MRLVTWNCRRGPYRVKARVLEKLHFDIAVMPESPRPATESESILWFGARPNRGVLVASSPVYRMRPIVMRGLAKFFVPIEVTGPENFLLFAIWAQQNQRRNRYVLGVVQAIKRCSALIRSEPAVLLGDFNSNTFWDRLYPRDANHTALVERLHDLGCVSAYHHFSARITAPNRGRRTFSTTIATSRITSITASCRARGRRAFDGSPSARTISGGDGATIGPSSSICRTRTVQPHIEHRKTAVD